MKKTTLLLLVACALILTALPASAAPVVLAAHGGHGGGHGGRGTVIVTGGWGWGWGWGWGYPGYGYGYGYDAAYGYGRPAWARVKTDVNPEEARVYLDGKLIGTADDFDGWPDYLYLRRGHYRLEFRLTGYEALTIEVDARPGATIKVDNHMKKIPGAPLTRTTTPMLRNRIGRARRETGSPPGIRIGEEIASRPMRRSRRRAASRLGVGSSCGSNRPTRPSTSTTALSGQPKKSTLSTEALRSLPASTR